jgi:hypothetical protein
MKKSLLAISAVAALCLGTVAPAMAYPAGQAPTLGLSSVSRLVPGESISVVVSRVKRDCSVSVSWEGQGITPVTGTVGRTGKTPTLRIATPTTAGVYTLKTSTISKACAGTNSDYTIPPRTITVGKVANVVAKLGTTSAFSIKNPTIRVSGTIKSGSLPVAGKSVTVTLKKTGMPDKVITPTTSATGAFNENFPGTTYSAGSYTAVVSFVSDSKFVGKSQTTKALTIR